MSSGQRETLAQRVSTTSRIGPGEPAGEAPRTVPQIKHCWYDGPHGRQAALLLEWRRVGDGYDGRIAVAVPESTGWVLVEMWVGSGLLTAC